MFISFDIVLSKYSNNIFIHEKYNNLNIIMLGYFRNN